MFHDFQKAIDRILHRAKNDGVRVFMNDDIVSMKTRFVLSRDEVYICRSLSAIELLESAIPAEDYVDYLYTKWFGELQNEINTKRGEGSHDQ